MADMSAGASVERQTDPRIKPAFLSLKDGIVCKDGATYEVATSEYGVKSLRIIEDRNNVLEINVSGLGDHEKPVFKIDVRFSGRREPQLAGRSDPELDSFVLGKITETLAAQAQSPSAELSFKSLRAPTGFSSELLQQSIAQIIGNLADGTATSPDGNMRATVSTDDGIKTIALDLNPRSGRDTVNYYVVANMLKDDLDFEVGSRAFLTGGPLIPQAVTGLDALRKAHSILLKVEALMSC